MKYAVAVTIAVIATSVFAVLFGEGESKDDRIDKLHKEESDD